MKEYKTSEAKRKAIKKYKQNNEVRFSFRAYKNTDAELIEYINTSSNKEGTIKSAIREKMERDK